jgi:hypothetical protein
MNAKELRKLADAYEDIGMCLCEVGQGKNRESCPTHQEADRLRALAEAAEAIEANE